MNQKIVGKNLPPQIPKVFTNSLLKDQAYISVAFVVNWIAI